MVAKTNKSAFKAKLFIFRANSPFFCSFHNYLFFITPLHVLPCPHCFLRKGAKNNSSCLNFLWLTPCASMETNPDILILIVDQWLIPAPKSALYEFDKAKASYNRGGLMSAANGTDSNQMDTKPRFDTRVNK